ncbi:carboxylate--amine ligase [Halosegnis sp.]|uniref:carboxylate--amine ligase n=1 Tax=Halosegnis sp. TaxID=2864959 RepID=UPI0035D4C195
MTEFRSFEELLTTLQDREFARPPAFVANAHVTGLSVARALAAHDVPVIALDRSGDGVAPASDAVVAAGEVTYPLADADEFRADIERLAAAVDHEPVAFGCMDEWALALADDPPAGVRLTFAADVVDTVLDKYELYRRADRLDVPFPETYFLEETDPTTAADALGFPLVVKPARKRRFEEAVGTNVLEVDDEEEFAEAVAAAEEAGVRVMAQEKVRRATGEDHSFASYISPDGEPLGVVGNARIRYPTGYGTSCVVDRVEEPTVRERAERLLADAGYYGISESEFLYDADREEFVLLDVNTRPWKWIGLAVAAGINLPMAAYADAIGTEVVHTGPLDARWVYLPDYLRLNFEDPGFDDVLSDGEWAALLSGEFEAGGWLTTGVYRLSDPGPARALLATEFADRDYYCAC